MHIGDSNPFIGPHFRIEIPNTKAGVVIGRNGDTLRAICQKSGAYIFIPKDSLGEQRVLEMSGDQDQIDIAKREIDIILTKGGGSGGDYYDGPVSSVVISDQNSTSSKLPASYASNYLLMNPQLAKISAELAGRQAQGYEDEQ